MNTVVIIGRIVSLEKDNLKIKVNKKQPDEKGNYNYYIVNTKVLGSIRKNVKEYCRKEDVVGIKGYIGKDNDIIVEKVSFLSSNVK